MNYKVLIPSAGLGTRLGNLSKNINKALVSVNNKPVISHVIEKFPKDVEIVVALGHKGALVRDYLEIGHDDRTIQFVDIDPYCGPGSGLGFTVLQCKDLLQCPFVFCPNDTLVLEKIPAPSENWMGYAEVENNENYRSLQVEDDVVKKLCEKSEGIGTKPYIGLAGINDYKKFWNLMESGVQYGSIVVGESYGLRGLIESGDTVISKKFTWYDAGNLEFLEKARTAFRQKDAPEILEKPNEAIWFVNKKVIKYSEDTDFISDRVERVKHIRRYVPEIVAQKKHMYAYRMIRGTTMSKAITRPLFTDFLSWVGEFWEAKVLDDEKEKEFKSACFRFYKNKTEQRVFQYFSRFRQNDNKETINGVKVPKVSDLLKKVDWKDLSEGTPVRYHGDLHFENILVAENGKLFMLDWRQNFSGLKGYGDIYYDFAKILHGLIVSHELVNKEQYIIEHDGGIVNFDILRKQKLVECEQLFEKFIVDSGYDYNKVRILTALVFLNISPLHHYPYSEFLFYLGKYYLHDSLEEKK